MERFSIFNPETANQTINPVVCIPICLKSGTVNFTLNCLVIMYEPGNDINSIKQQLRQKQQDFYDGIDRGIHFQQIKLLFKEIKTLEQKLVMLERTPKTPHG